MNATPSVPSSLSQRKWFYPLIYVMLVLIAFLPLITERPYNPQQDTPAVIFEILSRATAPYAAWGWVFHVLTIAAVTVAVWKPDIGGRVLAAYFGLNYLVVAATQSSADTLSYGYAVHTGALVAEVLLGALWLGVAWRGGLRLLLADVPRWRWLLLPFAVLVFWSPVRVEGTHAIPDFNPVLLLTSPGYGLAYCYLTPVFLFLLVLAWPNVSRFAFRVTAFNALIYALFNLNHWAIPERLWLGVMHLPLLVLSLVALGLAHFSAGGYDAHRRPAAPPTPETSAGA